MLVEKAGHWFQPGQWLFRDLSLPFEPGSIMTILGPNGTGKTTLLRALCRTLALREGRVMTDIPIGYVPQALAADHSYLALDMVLMGRTRFVGRMSAPGRRHVDYARACLDEVGLGDIAGRRYDRLSGGQRQLVLLARALATECRLLVLDEPASALDLANQGVVLRLLWRLARERRLAVVFTTHAPDHALEVADRVVLMRSQGDHRVGTPDGILTEINLGKMYGVAVKRMTISAGARSVEAIVPIYGARGSRAPDGLS